MTLRKKGISYKTPKERKRAQIIKEEAETSDFIKKTHHNKRKDIYNTYI